MTLYRNDVLVMSVLQYYSMPKWGFLREYLFTRVEAYTLTFVIWRQTLAAMTTVNVRFIANADKEKRSVLSISSPSRSLRATRHYLNSEIVDAETMLMNQGNKKASLRIEVTRTISGPTSLSRNADRLMFPDSHSERATRLEIVELTSNAPSGIRVHNLN